MAKRQKKSINSLLKGYASNEIEFSLDSTITFKSILAHVNKSQCLDCKWCFAVIGYQSLEQIKTFGQNCLIAMYGDLRFINGLPDRLKNEGFNENETFKPRVLDMVGAILIYCE